MEDTHRDYGNSEICKDEYSLNPCSNGKYS